MLCDCTFFLLLLFSELLCWSNFLRSDVFTGKNHSFHYVCTWGKSFSLYRAIEGKSYDIPEKMFYTYSKHWRNANATTIVTHHQSEKVYVDVAMIWENMQIPFGVLAATYLPIQVNIIYDSRYIEGINPFIALVLWCIRDEQNSTNTIRAQAENNQTNSIRSEGKNEPQQNFNLLVFAFGCIGLFWLYVLECVERVGVVWIGLFPESDTHTQYFECR